MKQYSESLVGNDAAPVVEDGARYPASPVPGSPVPSQQMGYPPQQSMPPQQMPPQQMQYPPQQMQYPPPQNMSGYITQPPPRFLRIHHGYTRPLEAHLAALHLPQVLHLTQVTA